MLQATLSAFCNAGVIFEFYQQHTNCTAYAWLQKWRSGCMVIMRTYNHCKINTTCACLCLHTQLLTQIATRRVRVHCRGASDIGSRYGSNGLATVMVRETRRPANTAPPVVPSTSSTQLRQLGEAPLQYKSCHPSSVHTNDAQQQWSSHPADPSLFRGG